MELPLHKSSLLLLEDNGVEFNIHLITLGLTLSIAGWIADVCFGRYGMVYWSMWIMWAALILATVSSVLARTVDSYTSNIHSYVNVDYNGLRVWWVSRLISFSLELTSFMMPQLKKLCHSYFGMCGRAIAVVL